MPKQQAQKKSGGTRKYGRNEARCKTYRMLHKKERSHIRRITRHMKKYKDSSPMAKEALERYRQLVTAK